MIPETLKAALAPVTLIAGHYGAGKTSFACNLALDGARQGLEVTLIDLDIVNPYFRASEQRELLEGAGVRLIAPVFADAGTSLDVPSLRGSIGPALEGASEGSLVIVDVGGDDAGTVALARFRSIVGARPYAMLGLLNRFRNQVQEPEWAVENLREIEAAGGLALTALVDNSHLKDLTTPDDLVEGLRYSRQVAQRMELPLVAVTVPEGMGVPEGIPGELAYGMKPYVRNPWEEA